MIKAAFKTQHIWQTVLFLVILALFCARIPLLIHRGFDPDEFQHLHGGYCVAQGLVPYNDYYEHHMPASPWLLSAVVSVWGTSWASVLAARGLMLLIIGVALVFTYRMLRIQAGTHTAMLSTVLLSCTLLFLSKSLEIRPDVPALLFWVLGLYAVLHAFRRKRLTHFALAGCALGVGFMFTPKLAFAAIGMGMGLLWALIRQHGSRSALKILLPPAVLLATAFVPFGIVLAILAAYSAVPTFLHDAILMNSGWPQELSPTVYIREFVEQNPFIALLGLAGYVHALWRSRAGGTIALLSGSATTLIIGWFLIPVPWPQFLLPLFPLWAYFAAVMLEALAARVMSLWKRIAAALPPRLLDWAWLLPVVGASLGILCVERFIGGSRPAVGDVLVVLCWMIATISLMLGGLSRPDRIRQGWFMGTIVISVIAISVIQNAGLTLIAPTVFLIYLVNVARTKQRPLAVMLAILMAMPIAQIHALSQTRNTRLRLEFETIMNITEPDETVLMGWRGCAVFRPHAYKYFFLHHGMLQVLDDDAKGRDVLEVITNTPPTVVIYDKGVKSLSDEVNAYILAGYTNTGVGDIWFRLP